MNIKLQNTIKEEMLTLPKITQETINSFEWIRVSEEIGEKYSLNDDKLDNFQLETFLVLLGLADKEKYMQNVEKNIGISDVESIKIVNEAMEKIFNPIGEIISRKIEENLKNKNPGWKQTLNFIISGGDYSVFMEKDNPKSIIDEIPKITILENSSKIADIKSKFTI